MSPVLSAFPHRPLTLKPGRGTAGAWVLAILGLLMFGGFFVLLAVQVVPAIREDLSIRAAAVPASQVRITNGRCRSRLALMQDCSMTLNWRGKDGPQSRQVSYMFVEPHLGDWTVVPMMDPARPDLVTTDLGLDRLTNRILTAAGFTIFVIAVLFGMALVLRKAQAKSREVRALSGRMLQPVPVRFLEATNAQGLHWRVADERGNAYEWPVGKRDKPFLLDEQQGLVLALRDPAGGPAFPLDEKLRLVELTPEERARIEQARQQSVRAA